MDISLGLKNLTDTGQKRTIQQTTTNKCVQDIWMPSALHDWIWTEILKSQQLAYQGVSLHAHLQTAVT